MDLQHVSQSKIGRRRRHVPRLRPSGAHYGPQPTASRLVEVVVTFLAALLSLGGLIGIVAQPAAANLAGSSFNASDGTLDTRASITRRTDLVKSSADTSYTQGAQEADACPAVESGSIPPSKDDFSDFYLGLEGEVLYLAFRRSDNNGTATVDFELNQSATDCGNGVNKVRTDGDLLVTYDYQGGATTPVILARTFTSGSFSAPVILTAAEAEASVSGDGLFGELAINLREVEIFVPGECVNFANVILKSRASSSFRSALKDFVSPISTSITNCASIVVIKDANLNGTTSFPFRFAPPAVAATDFQLVDDGVTTPDTTPDRRLFDDLADVNGSYVITETEPAVTPGEWRLEGIVCSGGTATVDLANNRVTVVPGGPIRVTCTFANTFDPAPTVVVQKSARPSTINEPGGSITYDVVVTNTSAEPVTLTDLTDRVGPTTSDVFTFASTTCLDNRVLAAADLDATGGDDTYRCSFNRTIAGNAGTTHTNVVTATVIDAEGDTAVDDDDAVVTIANVLPSISVSKTASSTSLLEPGGVVTFTVVVTNLSNEGVTLTDLTDTVATATNVFTMVGTTCVDNATLAAADATANGGADTYRCTFTRLVTGNAGTTHTNTVRATAVDDDGSQATASDLEEVVITDVAPTLSVLKTARTTTIAEPGGPITYDLSIQNLSKESVTLTELTDTIGNTVTHVFGIAGTTCADNTPLAANGTRGGGDTYTCSFTLPVTGNAGSAHDDRVTATVVDDEDNDASASDVERVTIFDVAPTISVIKTAAPASMPEPGGTVTYTVVVRNLSAEAVTLTDLTDTVASATKDVFAIAGTTCTDGTVLAASDGVAGGADTITCTFTGTVTGNATASHTNVVEAKVVDDDGTGAAASDDAVVTVTDILPGISVVKSASAPTVRVGDAVTYTYAVTTTTTESLVNLEVKDDKCSPVTFVSGDTDGDKELDPSETWTFRCTTSLTVDTTNVATASATDDEGNRATDTDTVTVDVINPAIAVDKTADRTSAVTGEEITYSYLVTNPGDSSLTGVKVSDDKCSPVSFVSGDTDGDGALDVGESWRYTCRVNAGAAGSLVNVAVATGTPPVGPGVTGQDTVTVEVKDAIVLGVVVDRPAPVAAVDPAPVVAPSVAPAVVAAPATLPRTGSNVDGPFRSALLLLIVGGMALVPEHLRRRRNRIVPIVS